MNAVILLREFVYKSVTGHQNFTASCRFCEAVVKVDAGFKIPEHNWHAPGCIVEKAERFMETDPEMQFVPAIYAGHANALAPTVKMHLIMGQGVESSVGPPIAPVSKFETITNSEQSDKEEEERRATVLAMLHSPRERAYMERLVPLEWCKARYPEVYQ